MEFFEPLYPILRPSILLSLFAPPLTVYCILKIRINKHILTLCTFANIFLLMISLLIVAQELVGLSPRITINLGYIAPSISIYYFHKRSEDDLKNWLTVTTLVVNLIFIALYWLPVIAHLVKSYF